jgi:hypothetical protein
MNKTFPIRIENKQASIERMPVKREEKPITLPKRSYWRWKGFEVIGIVLLLYGSIALAHGLSYVPDQYVCHHMARDIEDMLEPYGIEVTIVTGWSGLKNGTEKTNGSRGHAWIKIWGIDIDSVWLVPAPLRLEYPYKGKEYADYTEYAKTIYSEDEYLEKALAGEI